MTTTNRTPETKTTGNGYPSKEEVKRYYETRGTPCPQCGCPDEGDHVQDCPVTDKTKVEEIKAILRKYYFPEGEAVVAPENIIERIRAVIKK